MLVKGEWQRCDDGITRPLVRATVLDVAGISMPEDFLIDSGADRTVLSASLLTRLRLPTQSPPPELSLSGVGGISAFVIVTTVVEFSREDGGTVRMRGEFAGFTDVDATDLSVLGRDVLDHFDVLLSRRRNEVVLLAQRHRYRVEQA
jgi:hypothetical protein